MKNTKQQKTKITIVFNRWFLFPLSILLIYGILFAITPGKAEEAVQSSVNVFIGMLIPLAFVFAVMMLVNIFLKPSLIVKFLGKSAGLKGIIFAAFAGIVSTGPIYAWYPLLKDLREKGAGESLIAIFLYNRSVKPFLLPVLIGYFGFSYAVILVILTILSSVAVGYLVSFVHTYHR